MNEIHPPFSRGLSTAERAVFVGALWLPADNDGPVTIVL
jgi:hypothetical protein